MKISPQRINFNLLTKGGRAAGGGGKVYKTKKELPVL